MDRTALQRALAEDQVARDRTTRALFPRAIPARATVTAQASGVVSGITPAAAVGRLLGLRVRAERAEGARIRRGDPVLTLEGDLRRILVGERTILNYLMHLSGVATATAEAVRAARSGRGRSLTVLGTRKTTPGLRDLEKAAIGHGGGHPHRRDLSAAVLIKNNHLAFVGIAEAVQRARRSVGARFPIEVEVGGAEDAVAAARAGADAVLLDNLSPPRAREVVRRLEREGLREGLWIELSGGITRRNIDRYRRVGADGASLGALTHSAPALPFHLTVARLPRRGRRHSR